MGFDKDQLLHDFDPNSQGKSGKLFGLPFDLQNANVIIIPVPWEATVSYGAGTANGPESVLLASSQVDLSAFDIIDAWKLGVCLDDVDPGLPKKSNVVREIAEPYIQKLEEGHVVESVEDILNQVNLACIEMVQSVNSKAKSFLAQSKIVGILGGDHSSPLGLIQALAELHESFGILQFDAHADLRDSYEGFTYSHASIMYNALQIKSVKKLVQVGIRDFCDEEFEFIKNSNGRVRTFLYPEMKEENFNSQPFEKQVEEIVSELPGKVYISFDIDGLDPSLCPNTGTPVPGGFSFEEARYIIKKVVESGREIIGFDLCEVSVPANNQSDWDANVGARMLYNLVNYTGVSQGLLKMKPK